MNTSTRADRARFGDLMAAEWIKIRSLRSTFGITGFGVLFAVVAAWWQGHHVKVAPGAAAYFNPLIYPYDQLTWSFLTVLAATFGALSITGEYSSGLIRTTFAAVPARRRVILAKCLTVALSMALFGLIASLASLYVAGNALAGQLSGLSLSQSPVLRAAALSAALPVLGSQLGIAIGALIRHPLGAVGATWALLLLLPTLLGSSTIGLGTAVEAMPVSAWMTLAHTTSAGAHQSPTPASGAAWVLMFAWPLAALAVSTTAVARRDV
jgi:ABC-2 type transport system permease protein